MKNKFPSWMGVLALLTMLMGQSLRADDIDIYNAQRSQHYPPPGFAGVAQPPNPNYPNLLFILDGSLSMNFTDEGQVGTRMSRLRAAMRSVLSSARKINISIMRFSNRDSGGRVIIPMSPIESSRDAAIRAVDNLSMEWYTPSVGGLLEGALYYSGGPLYYGKTRPKRPWYTTQDKRLSHADSYSGGTLVRDRRCTDANLDSSYCESERLSGNPLYRSPILSECQKNLVILLTDGEATSAVNQAEVRRMTGKACTPVRGSSGSDNVCGVDIATFLATEDQAPNVPGINTVTTHTVGFNISYPPLEEIAAAGGGNYYEANSKEELVRALTEVVDTADIPALTLAQPSVSVDPSNLLANRKDIYLTLFQPSLHAVWTGNLKGYWYDGKLRDYSNPRKDAIEPGTGLFRDNASSLWSAQPDGPNVGLGGAASRLRRSGSRLVVTNNPRGSSRLTDGKNKVVWGNVNATQLGLPDSSLSLQSSDARTLLNWIGGQDTQDVDEDGSTRDQRNQYGDPIHTNPLVVTYGKRAQDNYESVVFFGTNDGFLHAVDTVTGQDLYSFVPWSLVSRLKYSFVNQLYGEKRYGMDGHISSWKHDADNNGYIDATGDHAYLYAGMRRGGRSYYALNVTNKHSPTLMWDITGGQGDFKELGQSWSKMVLGKMMHQDSVIDVLVFSGGYDDRQDDTAIRTSDRMGRAIYIVNAKTGKRIWHAGPNGASLSFRDMRFSIPATPAVIDVNGDGLFDQIYAADMGGQVWRFDVTSEGSISGGVIANLSTSTMGNRRFFSSPDVALVKPIGGKARLSVSLGSGARARPFSTAQQDRFYVLMQKDVFGAPAGYGVKAADGVYRPLTHETIDGLVDVTSNKIVEGNAAERKLIARRVEQSHGWYVNMERSGEKIVNPSVTASNKVIFTSYLPGSLTSCAASLGTSDLYILDIFDGRPVLDLNEDGKLRKQDRSTKLKAEGISAPPALVFSNMSGGETKVDAVVGTESKEIQTDDLTVRTYWSEIPDY